MNDSKGGRRRKSITDKIGVRYKEIFLKRRKVLNIPFDHFLTQKSSVGLWQLQDKSQHL